MKRKFAFLLALVLTFCLFVTACGDDKKSKEEELEDLQEEIEDLEEELDELKKQEATLKSEINEVTVPKFIGKMYYTEIENVEEYDRNFNLNIKWEDANNPDSKKGEVFKQEPAAGKTVKKGATVTLYVNSATVKEISLDVRAEIEGAHKDDVRKLLQDAGFVVNEITGSSDSIPADRVISININKGQSYPYGTKVLMVVSCGNDTSGFIVPNVVGLVYSDVKDVMPGGMPLKVIGFTYDKTTPEGVIVQQTPSAESIQPPESPIYVVVNAGPAETMIEPPRDLIGQNYPTVNKVLCNCGGSMDYISVREQNYTDDSFAEKDTVMAVVIDGIWMEDFPEQMAADADVVLIVSTGISAEDSE